MGNSKGSNSKGSNSKIQNSLERGNYKTPPLSRQGSPRQMRMMAEGLPTEAGGTVRDLCPTGSFAQRTHAVQPALAQRGCSRQRMVCSRDAHPLIRCLFCATV